MLGYQQPQGKRRESGCAHRQGLAKGWGGALEVSARSAVAFACMSPGVPDGQAVVLDVAQLRALLAKTFNVGLDVGRGKEPVALVRLRLAKALIGVAEANALAAESIAIERGVGTEQIAQTEALALHAAAFNGMPDPVFHLTARAMAIVTGLAAVEPDPRAGDNDVLLDAALQAATGLAAVALPRRVRDRAEREAATACLPNAEAELTKAAEAVSGLLELAKNVSAAAGRTGTSDLN